MTNNRLPSQKQHALLEYINEFITKNNYAPSYREVMRALDYKSVSTVASHINGLIERGWLVKRDNSARSVEVVYKTGQREALNSPAPSLQSPPHKERLSEVELLNLLSDARKQVEVGALYTHFKGGSYKVTGLAIQSSDDRVCVIYEAQYGEKIVFTRPIIEWMELVEKNGTHVPRFSKD